MGIRAGLAALVISTLAAGVPLGVARAAQEAAAEIVAQPLAPGAPAERELRGGETHVYGVRLGEGECASLTIEQIGIETSLLATTPGGVNIWAEETANWVEPTSQPFTIVAGAAGEYRVSVSALGPPNQPPGRYTLRLAPLRPATQTDLDAFHALELAEQARKLVEERTAVAIRGAIGRYVEAADLWRRVGAKRQEATLAINAGELANAVSDYPRARELGERALPLAREAGDRYHEAQVLNMLGQVTSNLGDDRQAVTYFEQSLAMTRELGDTRAEAAVLTNLGKSYRVLGELDRAFDTITRALDLHRKLGDRRTEASALNSLGAVYLTAGEYQTALEYFTQCYALAEPQKHLIAMAVALHNIGHVHDDLGQPELATDYYLRSLPLVEQLGNRFNAAQIRLNLGVNALDLGDPAKAEEYFTKALETFHDLKSTLYESVALAHLGKISLNRGDLPKADERIRRALEIQHAARNPMVEADILCDMGDVLAARGEREAAIDHYRRAATAQHAGGDRQAEAFALARVATAERDRGDLAEAEASARQAVALAESLRARLTRQDFRQEYGATFHGYPELLVDILMREHARRPDAGRDRDALAANEAARARVLVEGLGAFGVDARPDAALAERAAGLRRRLAGKLDRLFQLTNARAADEALEPVRREIDDLEAQTEAVEAKIREASPAYAALMRPEPLTVDGIRTELDAETVLVEYALGEHRGYVWAVTKSGLVSAELPGREQVEARARRVRELLMARSCPVRFETAAERAARLKRADAEYAVEAAALSKMVLEPVATAIAGKRLVVVADGALQLVPFGALPEPGGRGGYVLEGHEVVMVPSATVLVAQRRLVAGRKAAPKAVAVLADPVFEATDGRVTAAKPGGAKTGEMARRAADAVRGECEGRAVLERLEASRQEAGAIGRLVPASERLEALDFRANLELATSGRLGEYRMVHFATHGYVPAESPELSGLVLSLVDESGKEREGYLGLPQVYGMKLPAEVVTLSACETGLGREVRGEGLVGLVRGFMYAGARRVVASLWKVDDRETAELMAGFYEGMLVEKRPPAAALRRAQIRMARAGRAPYYWAAFQLHGEWR